nr:GH32 C-terminal domain-containing protein [Enterococcus faecium]
MIDNQLVLEIFRDTSSIEVFINGLEVMTATFYELEKARDIFSFDRRKSYSSF